MLYLLYRYDEGDTKVFGAYEGLDNLNIDKIRNEFQANFDYRKLGKINYPKYAGPMVPYKKPEGVSYSSGSIGSPLVEGTLIPDYDCKEYADWRKECEKEFDAFNRHYKDNFKKMQENYPGKDTDEIFLSFLEQEYGLKEVKSQRYTI